MEKLKGLQPERVFKYFEEICSIPHGSGDMNAISEYCVAFAEKHSLKAIRDEANNVIIFKDGTPGYENSEPVILQGHLDMVCQKTADSNIDFEKDGLDICIDGDYVTANGTTLGADNGIAVAMVLSILESDTIPHPPIEAVFTTDEEIGMLGAMKLCMDSLKGKKMINLDAEEPETLTVSCAGGSDFRMTIPVKREKVSGTMVEIALKGLKGGHSGIEINTGRVNADILAGRVLNCAKSVSDFKLISVDGGDKPNAIPLYCSIKVVTEDIEKFVSGMKDCLELIKKEISDREAGFEYEIITQDGEFDVMDKDAQKKLMFALIGMPNGVMEMSYNIKDLVETSLNLGILKTENDKVVIHSALRSNKQSSLVFMEERMRAFATYVGAEVETFGHYPPWEYKDNSPMQKMYIETYKDYFGFEPKVVAIHAGLECGVFASKINDFDCIAIGPQLSDVHTVNETLKISSTKEIYEVLLNLLKKCK